MWFYVLIHERTYCRCCYKQKLNQNATRPGASISLHQTNQRADKRRIPVALTAGLVLRLWSVGHCCSGRHQKVFCQTAVKGRNPLFQKAYTHSHKLRARWCRGSWLYVLQSGVLLGHSAAAAASALTSAHTSRGASGGGWDWFFFSFIGLILSHDCRESRGFTSAAWGNCT